MPKISNPNGCSKDGGLYEGPTLFSQSEAKTPQATKMATTA